MLRIKGLPHWQKSWGIILTMPIVLMRFGDMDAIMENENEAKEYMEDLILEEI